MALASGLNNVSWPPLCIFKSKCSFGHLHEIILDVMLFCYNTARAGSDFSSRRLQIVLCGMCANGTVCSEGLSACPGRI